MRRLLALALACAVPPAGVAAAQDQPPRPPDASTRAAVDVGPRDATLVGVVVPHGQPTSYRFEYGPTPALGSATPTVAVGTSGGRTVTARLTGLEPFTRTYYRIVAAADAGEARGGVRSFSTRRELLGLSLQPRPEAVVLGETLRLDGSISGTGTRNVPVALEAYVGRRWRALGRTVRSGPAGEYSFSVSPVLAPLRLRAVTRTNPPVSSPIRDTRTRPRVGLTVRRGSRGRRSFALTVRPALSPVRVSLQRKSSRGRWVPVVRRTLRGRGGKHRLTITRRARRGAYRVVALPKQPGWSRGWSRERAIAGGR